MIRLFLLAMALIDGSAMADEFRRDKLYPLVVPSGYAQGSVHRRLVDGIEVTLVLVVGEPTRSASTGIDVGLIRSVTSAELAAAKLDEAEAYRIALENLEAAAHRGDIHAAMLGGDHGAAKFVLFSDHWLAATCVLLGGLHKMAAAALAAERLVVLIPHRNVMIVFPDGDAASREKWRRYFLEKEKDGRKPITDRMLRLSVASGKPFYEQPPVELIR